MANPPLSGRLAEVYPRSSFSSSPSLINISFHLEQFDDGRETELLHWIYNQPNLDEIRGSPQKIIDLIDNFGQNRHFMMNVGPTKGKVITDLIAKVKPHTMIELGGYVGYSAILFGDALRRAGGQRYISLERNPEFGAIVMALVDLAGLKDVVQVVIGSSDRSLHRLHAEGQVDKIEMMFLDHFKPAYTTDLKLCEQLGMVQPGSLMVADNVYVPGAPVYLKYVRSTIESKRAEAKEAKQEHSLEGTSERHRNQYLNKVDQEKPAFAVTGNPNLVYENETVEEWDVSGSWDAIQLTKCVGVADD